jgi:exodeoxyribonuclease-5
MQLSPQQSEALATVKRWARDRDSAQVFRLFGFAGTGKTTIARQFEHTVGGTVLYAAFTGKAALVLRNKGCNATTIHKLIYVPNELSHDSLEDLEVELLQAEQQDPKDEKYIAQLKADIEAESNRLKSPRFTVNPESELNEADLLVVDEVSMVGKDIARDLLSFGKKILVLGDPAQLPPVGSAGFFINAEPDFLLTEIHRQAEDSPVLRLATLVRNGSELSRGSWGSSRVVPVGTLSLEEVAAFDQVIVGTNRARRDLNRQIRQHLGHKNPLPEVGDKLIALRNNYEKGILNGSQWHVSRVLGSSEVCSTVLIHGSDGDSQICSIWNHYFEGKENEIRPWDMNLHQHFDFGYAITCHKAQGSQWNNLLVIDESSVFRGDRRKWLYTAITRAAESVTIVKKR